MHSFGMACALALACLNLTRPQQGSGAPQPRGEALVGVTVPSRSAAVAPEQSGTIVAMPAKEGDRVTTGQTLFKLSSRLQELEVRRLEAIVNSGISGERARANLSFAKGKEGRLTQLKEIDITSQSDLETVQLEHQLAQATVREAELSLDLYRIELAQAKERLAQRTVASPFDGIVTRWIKQLGESSEQLLPVIEVMCLHPLWVEFECPVAKEKQFRLGSLVRVTPVVGEQAAREATIIYMSMRATPASHTFVVRAAVPNENYSWRAGLKMRVEFNDGDAAAQAPAVPGGK